jgi:hypothetical protein
LKNFTTLKSFYLKILIEGQWQHVSKKHLNIKFGCQWFDMELLRTYHLQNCCHLQKNIQKPQIAAMLQIFAIFKKFKIIFVERQWQNVFQNYLSDAFGLKMTGSTVKSKLAAILDLSTTLKNGQILMGVRTQDDRKYSKIKTGSHIGFIHHLEKWSNPNGCISTAL